MSIAYEIGIILPSISGAIYQKVPYAPVINVFPSSLHFTESPKSQSFITSFPYSSTCQRKF